MIAEAFPPPNQLVDLRKTAVQVHHGQRVAPRSWKSTTAIVWHQSAVVLGERPSRYNTLGAHFAVTRAGSVMQCHEINSIVAHAGLLNTRTVGIEIDGMYAGVEGDLRTFWKPTPDAKPQTLTAAAIESAKQLGRWIYSEVQRNGGEVRFCLAHRQASGQRRSDPGSAVWSQIVLPLMAELGLSDGGPDFKVGDGLPIPTAWSALRTAKY